MQHGALKQKRRLLTTWASCHAPFGGGLLRASEPFVQIPVDGGGASARARATGAGASALRPSCASAPRLALVVCAPVPDRLLAAGL